MQFPASLYSPSISSLRYYIPPLPPRALPNSQHKCIQQAILGYSLIPPSLMGLSAGRLCKPTTSRAISRKQYLQPQPHPRQPLFLSRTMHASLPRAPPHRLHTIADNDTLDYTADDTTPASSALRAPCERAASPVPGGFQSAHRPLTPSSETAGSSSTLLIFQPPSPTIAQSTTTAIDAPAPTPSASDPSSVSAKSPGTLDAQSAV